MFFQGKVIIQIFISLTKTITLVSIDYASQRTVLGIDYGALQGCFLETKRFNGKQLGKKKNIISHFKV